MVIWVSLITLNIKPKMVINLIIRSVLIWDPMYVMHTCLILFLFYSYASTSPRIWNTRLLTIQLANPKQDISLVPHVFWACMNINIYIKVSFFNENMGLLVYVEHKTWNNKHILSTWYRPFWSHVFLEIVLRACPPDQSKVYCYHVLFGFFKVMVVSP